MDIIYDLLKSSGPDVSCWTWDQDSPESITSASNLDLLLLIGRGGQLHTSIYDKRDDFNFHTTNFPFLNSNIPSSPAYGFYLSNYMMRPDLLPLCMFYS